MSSKTKVIIAGAGIAGPVLAIFLKTKGYDPIVYERVNELSDVGLSLALQPNGLRVLNLIPDFVDSIVGRRLERAVEHSVLPGEESVLIESDAPSHLATTTGFAVIGVSRPVFHRTIVEAAERHGVKIVWGHQLVDLQQHEDHVNVTFANGATDSASFVVGCDGLHSNTRLCLFGQETVSFTGLTQTGGISPIPDSLKEHPPSAMNFYGDNAHMIAYHVSDTQISWAITLREDDAKETWRDMDEHRQNEFREGPFSQWPFGAGDLVRASKKIVKYGLYDRPELKSWHQGRVVLLGDAAHPTSPHLGQGANQAFEDIYHLIRLLTKHNFTGGAPSTELLSTIFTEYESLRIQRTSALVQGARAQGNLRVVAGVEACRQRNEVVRKAWDDEEAMQQRYRMLYAAPFTGESEI